MINEPKDKNKAYPSFGAKNIFYNIGAISWRFLNNGLGCGFLGYTSLDHGANSESSQERKSHKQEEEVAITRRKTQDEKVATNNEHHGIGSAQNHGGPSHVLELWDPHCLYLSMSMLSLLFVAPMDWELFKSGFWISETIGVVVEISNFVQTSSLQHKERWREIQKVNRKWFFYFFIFWEREIENEISREIRASEKPGRKEVIDRRDLRKEGALETKMGLVAVGWLGSDGDGGCLWLTISVFPSSSFFAYDQYLINHFDTFLNRKNHKWNFRPFHRL